MKRNALLKPLWGIALTGMAFAIAGCPQPSETGGNATSDASNGSPAPGATGGDVSPVKTVGPDEKVKVAFITNNTSDFWTIARRGVEKADAELPNLEAEFKMPQKGTAAEQTAIIDDLLAKGVHGLAISPKDPAGQTSMLNKTAEKVLVVTQDSDAADSKRACYVGTDNFAARKTRKIALRAFKRRLKARKLRFCPILRAPMKPNAIKPKPTLPTRW
jgi:ABC-type sugar transport system substrate-binding protein